MRVNHGVLVLVAGLRSGQILVGATVFDAFGVRYFFLGLRPGFGRFLCQNDVRCT